MDYCPIQGESDSHPLNITETGDSAGFMGHVARKGFNFSFL